MNLLQQIQAEQVAAMSAPSGFKVGDDVRVYVRIKDGDKARTQVFEGTVIAMKGSGPGATFTVRKTSFGVGVERIFPFLSPSVEKVELKTGHSVRRSKLYYLRERAGKSARLKDVQPH